MSLMHTTDAIWLRPGLTREAFFEREHASQRASLEYIDTALFDVDGVLIDTRRSYRLSVIAASERLVRVVNGLTDAPSPMVSPEDIAHFKLAGGFNSDWDATQLFAALWTARLREWRGRPEADVSLQEWASRASAAARAGQGGVAWLRATVPASAIPDDDVARWAHDEFYWGAALVREIYGHVPEYAPEAEGFVHNEELLLDEALLPQLRRRGVSKLGLITGRVGPEVGRAVSRIVSGCALVEGENSDGAVWFESEHGRSPFGCIVPATVFAKPDPRALAHAIEALGSRAAVYVGDTADDLDLVLRYRRESRAMRPELPPVLAVTVASGREADEYRRRGADVVVSSVRSLPQALAMAGFAADVSLQ